MHKTMFSPEVSLNPLPQHWVVQHGLCQFLVADLTAIDALKVVVLATSISWQLWHWTRSKPRPSPSSTPVMKRPPPLSLGWRTVWRSTLMFRKNYTMKSSQSSVTRWWNMSITNHSHDLWTISSAHMRIVVLVSGGCWIRGPERHEVLGMLHPGDAETVPSRSKVVSSTWPFHRWPHQKLQNWCFGRCTRFVTLNLRTGFLRQMHETNIIFLNLMHIFNVALMRTKCFFNFWRNFFLFLTQVQNGHTLRSGPHT